MDEKKPGVATKGAIVVDPRPLLNSEGETWTFSLDAHKNMFSFLTAIWSALRETGVYVPPLTYGKTWILFEPHAGRTISPQTNPQSIEEARSLSLKAAGIRPGTTLLVMSPERALEAVEKGYEYQSDFAKKYIAQGHAERGANDLLTVLRARGIVVPDAVRERVLGQKDPERLERWLEKAAVATSIADVLDELT